MYKELDIVKTKNKLNVLVPAGTMGVVHQAYDDDPPAYLVEFVDEASETLDILEVSEVEIELVKSHVKE
jgi:hypothetical protein